MPWASPTNRCLDGRNDTQYMYLFGATARTKCKLASSESGSPRDLSAHYRDNASWATSHIRGSKESQGQRVTVPTLTHRMSFSAASRSDSRVKQWQCTSGIISYRELNPPSHEIEDKDPRKASRNSSAVPGRFMTKWSMRLRGDMLAGIGSGRLWARRCRASFSNCFGVLKGSSKPGNGLCHDSWVTFLMNCFPSSQETRTREATYEVRY